MLSLGRVSVLLVAIVVSLAVPRVGGPPTLDWRLAEVARDQGFNLWQWEVQTLASRTWQSAVAPAASDQPSVVLQYAAVTREANQILARRDDLWAKRAMNGSTDGLAETQRQLDQQEAELARLRPIVEATVSREDAAELTRRGLVTNQFVQAGALPFPFLRFDAVPPVFFQIGPLPRLLVVAPVDRVALVGSVLLQSDLSTDQVDRLEHNADGLGVSSVVTGIGGLAAYPSMLPDDESTQDLLITVAHEWTHHYLAFRPLGQSYFNSYDMREINETVADLVGHEVGNAVYRQTYQPLVASAPSQPARPAPAPTAPQPARPDFYTEMRQIRVNVDAYLARHDVAGADAYMASQQQVLAGQGYYVRRLNTAYLAFFGSYSGTANPYEAQLRLLRSREPTLAAFLETVSTVRTPEDLARLLAR